MRLLQSYWRLLTIVVLLSCAGAGNSMTMESQLEQIKLDSKSKPREANIEIDRLLADVLPQQLQLRETLITTKAFNLLVLSEYDAAQQLLESWLAEVQRTNPAKATRALEISGSIAMRRGQHMKASVLLQEALQLATKYNQAERQITVRIYTAIQAIHTGDFHTAMALLQAAQALNAQHKFPHLTVNIQNNISSLRIQMGQYAEALAELTAALSDPAYLPDDLIYVQMSLAQCYIALQRYAEALPHARAALQGYLLREDSYYQSVIYLMLAEIAFFQQEADEVMLYLQPALMLAEKHQLNQQLLNGYLLKSKLMQQQQQPEHAFQALEMHLKYYKNYHNEEAQKQLLQLRNQIDSLQQQNQIVELTQQLEVNSLKASHQKRTALILATTSGAIILLLLFLMRLQQKKRQQAELFSSQLSASYEQLKQTQRSLITSEKMAAIAGMVAGLAHELNTPLGVLTTAVSLMQEKNAEFSAKLNHGLTRQELQQYLATTAEAQQLSAHNIARCANLVQSFKQLAVNHHEQHRQFNLQQLISDISTLLNSKFNLHHISLVYNKTELILKADPQHFQLLLIELFNNAIAHAFKNRAQGQITLYCQCLPSHWELHYQDNGVGFPQTTPEKVFEPFFTTGRHSGHNGLGLNLVYNLVTIALQGELEVLPASNGVALCFRFPNSLLTPQAKTAFS